MIEHICTKHTYFIAWNDDMSAHHSGEAETGQHIATGLDHLETFDDTDDWSVRKNELGIEEE